MAVVAQANLVQLQVAANKRFGAEAPTLRSPGAVITFREALIGWRDIKDYSEAGLSLRTREVWGQHCLFCWVFMSRDPHHPPRFIQLAPEDQIRCAGHIGAKLLEIEKGLWRLRHEDRLRNQPELRDDPHFRKEYEAALNIPMLVYGQNIRTCGDDDLLACTCEYAGMLAAIRWIADDRWQWGQATIMELDGRPDTTTV